MQNKKQDQVTPLYATLLYDVKRELGISWTEYVYLDMVYHLSHDGWCYKSVPNTAHDLGIDRSNVFRMRDRLIAMGLLKKNIRGHVKTTELYQRQVTKLSTEDPQFSRETVAKRDGGVAKRDSSSRKTRPKNNNRTTIENKRSAQMRASTGLESARAIAERIRQRRLTA